jgi:Spo7-like protein
MYLNVRQPPLRSKLPGLLRNPIRFFFPRPAPLSSPPSPSVSRRSTSLGPPPRIRTRSDPSPLIINDPDSPVTQAPVQTTTTNNNPTPIAPIPPTNNPRGELIFSSRVHPGFRESYERYRAAFERKREEREREAAVKTWFGWIRWRIKDVFGGSAVPSAGMGTGDGGRGLGSRTTSLRGRGPGTGSGGGTPTGSRRGSPVPGHIKTGSSRSGTPLEMRRSVVL